MKLYGAGSLDDIRKCTELGVVGILTNPQGFEQYFKGEMTLDEITQAIVNATDLPVFIQIHGQTTDALVDKARKLNAIAPKQVGFKLISDEKGFQAIRRLQKEGINCIATALFSVSQAAIAACVGAFGICPFVSRARDFGIDASELLLSIREGYDRLATAPEIVVVSLKSVADVDLALASGADAVAMRYPLIQQMMQHPLSTKAELLFAKNWANVKGEDIGYLRHALTAEGISE